MYVSTNADSVTDDPDRAIGTLQAVDGDDDDLTMELLFRAVEQKPELHSWLSAARHEVCTKDQLLVPALVKGVPKLHNARWTSVRDTDELDDHRSTSTSSLLHVCVLTQPLGQPRSSGAAAVTRGGKERTKKVRVLKTTGVHVPGLGVQPDHRHHCTTAKGKAPAWPQLDVALMLPSAVRGKELQEAGVVPSIYWDAVRQAMIANGTTAE